MKPSGEKKPYISETDRQLLKSLPQEKLFEIMMFNIRNIWRVDGLYFQGIEKRFGTTAATTVDAETWATMGTLEARALKEILELKEFTVETVMDALRYTSWTMDHLQKEIEVENGKGILKIINCRTQLARLRKDMLEFPCKHVRHAYLINFAKEMNPRIKCICAKCPPDEHVGEVWCEWHFTME
jgi:hypothetical protein